MDEPELGHLQQEVCNHRQISAAGRKYIPGKLGHVGSGAHNIICWVTSINVTNIVWNFNQLACPKLPGAKSGSN